MKNSNTNPQICEHHIKSKMPSKLSKCIFFRVFGKKMISFCDEKYCPIKEEKDWNKK